MLLKRYTAITLDNNQEYGIAENIELNHQEYVLLVNMNNKQDCKFAKVTEEKYGLAIKEINEEEFKMIYPLFYKKAKNLLKTLGIINKQ